MRALFAVAREFTDSARTAKTASTPTVVTRRGFSRPEAPSIDKRCAALPPASRPAIAHLSSPGFPHEDRSLGFSWGQSVRWLQPTRVLVLDSSSLAAPHGTPGRRIVRLRTWRAPLADATVTHDCTSAGLAPVHHDPPLPFRGNCVGEKGFSGSEPPIDFCKRDNDVRAHPRASTPRPPPDHVPLAERMIPWRLPSVDPRGARHWQRAAEARPKRIRLGRLRQRRRPGCSHGPDDLERRARSLLGFLRTFLLRSRPSIPLSPARCPRSLECSGRASRGPSRPVSRVERGRAWCHALA